jgi:hypothetical protein
MKMRRAGVTEHVYLRQRLHWPQIHLPTAAKPPEQKGNVSIVADIAFGPDRSGAAIHLQSDWVHEDYHPPAHHCIASNITGML